jgi:hypothetical protein
MKKKTTPTMKKIERLKTGILTLQTKTIAIRTLKLNIRTLRFLIIYVGVQIIMPIAFYLTNRFTGRTGAYYNIIVLNATLTRMVVTSQVEERAKKFRSTFKLMGMTLAF